MNVMPIGLYGARNQRKKRNSHPYKYIKGCLTTLFGDVRVNSPNGPIFSYEYNPLPKQLEVDNTSSLPI